MSRSWTSRGCPRARSREITYEHDLTERAAIDEQVVRMAGELTREVVAEGRVVVRVAVKVRTSTFFTRTKISKLPEPTTDPAEVERVALAVLDRFELDRPVRLLGVRVELDRPTTAPSTDRRAYPRGMQSVIWVIVMVLVIVGVGVRARRRPAQDRRRRATDAITRPARRDAGEIESAEAYRNHLSMARWIELQLKDDLVRSSVPEEEQARAKRLLDEFYGDER